MRCFISIDIPENIKEEIKKIQEQLPDFTGKKIESENLHLTLKFLGEINDDKLEEIKKRLVNIKFKKFEAEINSIGVFSEKIIRIVWMHLTNCDGLQKEIDKSLKGIFESEQRFMSHLTIARVKNIKNKKEFLEKLDKVKIPKIKFAVDNFKLKSSALKKECPVYWDVEIYDLR